MKHSLKNSLKSINFVVSLMSFHVNWSKSLIYISACWIPLYMFVIRVGISLPTIFISSKYTTPVVSLCWQTTEHTSLQLYLHYKFLIRTVVWIPCAGSSTTVYLNKVPLLFLHTMSTLTGTCGPKFFTLKILFLPQSFLLTPQCTHVCHSSNVTK